MNPYLRQALDAADQTALLDHAAEMTRTSFTTTAVATLPSGASVKISTAERIAVAWPKRQCGVPRVSCTSARALRFRGGQPHPATGGPQQFISAKLPAGRTVLPRPRMGGDRRRTRFGPNAPRPGGRAVRHPGAHHPHSARRILRHRRRVSSPSSKQKPTVTISPSSSPMSTSSPTTCSSRWPPSCRRGPAADGSPRRRAPSATHRWSTCSSFPSSPTPSRCPRCATGSRTSKNWYRCCSTS